MTVWLIVPDRPSFGAHEIAGIWVADSLEKAMELHLERFPEDEAKDLVPVFYPIQNFEPLKIIEGVVWHPRTDRTSLKNYDGTWEHDLTQEWLKTCLHVREKYPDLALTWADCEFGAYRATTKDGKEFEVFQGVRGIGYKGVIAFDSEGYGCVFI